MLIPAQYTRIHEPTIVRVLRKNRVGGDAELEARTLKWRSLVKGATYYLLYRRMSWLAGAAQTEGPRTSRCVLGMEPAYIIIQRIRADTIGHELIHVAQEARGEELRKEWAVRSLWQAFGDELAMETEAWFLFRLVPTLFATVI